MACSHLQGTGLQSTGSVASLAKAYTSNVTAGNLLVVGIIGNKAAAAPTFTGTPPSGNSNTFTQRVTNPSPSATSRADVWSAKNCNAGATTITVTPSASSFVSIGISEVAGADTTAPEGNTGVGGATGTAAATGSVTVATSGEILLGIVSHESAGTTITPGGTFSQIFEDEDATEMPFNWEYQVVSANTAATWTIGASSAWLAAAASFKAAAAAATADYPIYPAQATNRGVGPQVMRLGKRSPVPVDLTQAPVTDTNFGGWVRVPNNRVGPPVLRALYRSPTPFDASVLAPVTDTNFAAPARMPNNRVGPPVLRQQYRPPIYPFDSTLGVAASGNRIRRLICSSSDA